MSNHTVVHTAPGSRVRTNFTQSAKGEWRVSEITVEVTDAEAPAKQISHLFNVTREEAEKDIKRLNNPATISINGTSITNHKG